jgi:hypothetical protein
MNEQIRLLWTQVCQDEMPWLDETCMTLPRQRKFAQLIVRECARVYWNIDDGEIHGEYVKVLKEHFGVKE